MKKPVLVIMAAGMGSRFGGLKQIAPVDDSGHIIMDYSLYDAKRAGFGKVVFVIKKELEDDFKAAIGNRVSSHFDVSYVFQDINDLPEGFSVPEGRVKPWGTGHAVASCRNVIDAPFAVINADDFYGRSAFDMIYRFLSGGDESGRYGMVGFRLRNTLTENGSVARGQCSVQDGLLTAVTERTEIYPKGDDAEYRAEDGSMVEISGDTVVSMNFWGFSSDMARTLWERFPAYLEAGLRKDPVRFEYYLPSVVNDQISDGTCTVTVLTCEDSWHGVTYTDDLPDLKKAISQMQEEGTYPVSLWD
ncbi:MAG: nucleotidyltransferase [Oscillospiraceae bacterium]|nr:nucleotidyltransferase [Oscillospiraceae bacterium]